MPVPVLVPAGHFLGRQSALGHGGRQREPLPGRRALQEHRGEGCADILEYM